MRDVLRGVGVFVMATLLATGTAADTIYMKNGSVIRGTVLGYGNGEFSVQLTGSGGSRSRATLAGDDIDRIEFDGTGPMGGATSGGYDPQPRDTASTDDANGAGGGSLPDDNSGVDDPGPDAGGGGGVGVSQPPLAGSGPVGGRETATPVTGRKEATVSVEPKSDWTNTQMLLRRGARVRITATGSVKLDAAGRRSSGPAGTDLADRDKLMPSRPTGALIAVIGDDNDDFIFVGAQAEFVTQRDGFLFLSVNEGVLRDNTGSYSARVVVEAGPPSASAPPRTGGGIAGPAARNTPPPKVRENPPAANPRPSANTNPPTTSPTTSPARTDPVTGPATSSAVRELDVVVQSNIDWTNTKVRVQRGNVVRVSATGTVTLRPGGGRTGPAGIETSDSDKLIPNGPTGGLIAVVGDDNDDFVYLGASGQFTSRHDGVLFMSVNEGNLRDNVGTFNARVAVEQVRVEGPDAGAARTGTGAPPRTQPADTAPAPAPKPAAPAIGANGGSAELTIQAKNDWTGTQIAIKKGMKVKITATGSVKLSRVGQASVSPAGNATADPLKLIADKPTGALIAVIGDDNSEYIFIGTGAEFVAERDGILYLGLNEGEVSDNSGAFIVRVVVTR